MALARRGARRGGRLPRRLRCVSRIATRLFKDDPVVRRELDQARALRLGATRLVQHASPGHRPPVWSGSRPDRPPMRSTPRVTPGAPGVDPPPTGPAARGDRHRDRGRRGAEPLGPGRARRAYSALEGGVPRSSASPRTPSTRSQGARDVPGPGCCQISRRDGDELSASRRISQGRWGEAARLVHAGARAGIRARRRRDAGSVTLRPTSAKCWSSRADTARPKHCSTEARDTLRASEYVYAANLLRDPAGTARPRNGRYLPTAVADLTRLVEEAAVDRRRRGLRWRRGSTFPMPSPAAAIPAVPSRSSPRHGVSLDDDSIARSGRPIARICAPTRLMRARRSRAGRRAALERRGGRARAAARLRGGPGAVRTRTARTDEGPGRRGGRRAPRGTKPHGARRCRFFATGDDA